MTDVRPLSTTSATVPLGRETLVGAIAAFLGDWNPRTLAVIRESIEREIDAAGPEALARLTDRLAAAGTEWTYYPPDPLARRIHRVLADAILERGSTLMGIEHEPSTGEPVVIVANHLSYSDANLLEVLLARAGSALADRLTVIAGPKVYSSVKRRFSSLCFGTIKTPQSSARSTEEAVMNAREVARAARRSIEIAHQRLRAGDALVVFAEGTRSRTRETQQTLAGVSRYLECPGTLVLPAAITGTEAMFPIDDDRLHTVRVVARLGRPIPAGALSEGAAGDRRLMMDAIGLAIAHLLPPEYRGAYADTARGLGDARRLLRHVSAHSA